MSRWQVGMYQQAWNSLFWNNHDQPRCVSRDSIVLKVWGTEFEGESRTVDMHIKTLRQKLGDAGSRIRTVRNVGYVIE